MPQHAKLELITYGWKPAKFSGLQCSVNQTTYSLARCVTNRHIAAYSKQNARDKKGVADMAHALAVDCSTEGQSMPSANSSSLISKA